MNNNNCFAHEGQKKHKFVCRNRNVIERKITHEIRKANFSIGQIIIYLSIENKNKYKNSKNFLTK